MTPRLTTISPAFRSFLAASGPDDARDAIIVYDAPAVVPAPRGRLRALKQRLDDIKQRAAAQKPTGEDLLSSFRRGGDAQRPSGRQLEAERAGDNLPILYAEVTRRTLPKLACQPNVVAILPNQRVRHIGAREVRRETLKRGEAKDKVTWGLSRLGIPEMWKTTRGADINVAVLDTGVYGDHEALKGRVKDFVIFDPIGRAIPTRGATFDSGEHGTHVCGTIAGGRSRDGVAIGVAPDAKLLVAAVLLAGTTIRGLVKAIDWAIDKGAHIISMSLGFEYYEPLFGVVFQRVLDYGILPVVAVGNENHGNMSSPGSAHNAFSVGAVERATGGRSRVDVAFFSSGASLSFPGQATPLVIKPDVVAPGAQVYSCIPPERSDDGKHLYAYMDGTSMAAPHVAGVAALLMAARPEAPVTSIAEELRATAEHPSGRHRPDNRWGYGLVRPAKALDKL